MNNGKGVPSLDGMACSSPWHDQPQFLPGYALARQKVLDFLRSSNTNLLEKILITAGII